MEGGAVQAVAFVPDAAAEGIDDATGDIQPKPRPVLRVFRVNLAVANRRAAEFHQDAVVRSDR